MSVIDDQLFDALSEEDQLKDIKAGVGIFELLGLIFSGKQAWMIWYIYAVSIAFLIAAVVFFNNYTEATDIRAALDWALLLIACMFIFTIIKMAAWQHMCKREMLQEVHRVQMQLMAMNKDKN